MKKIIIVLFLFTIILLITNGKEEYIIPNEAIRFRVIANSNNFEDQATKMEIKNNIENIVADGIRKSKNKTEAKNMLNQKLPDIENMINHYNIPYDLNYGNNYFPEKSYKGVKYPSGIYESLVVTLGTGKGDNWWCVMYPPLCLMENQTNEMKNTEYSFFVKEMFQKFL